MENFWFSAKNGVALSVSLGGGTGSMASIRCHPSSGDAVSHQLVCLEVAGRRVAVTLSLAGRTRPATRLW